ncbi:MAG: phasin family protein [Burkholderiales bacterium]|nr:phasin family protein [Burkholderiales bacterium]
MILEGFQGLATPVKVMFRVPRTFSSESTMTQDPQSTGSKPKTKAAPKAKASAADASHTPAASKDIWLAGLGAMAQAQAQGSKAFEALVHDGLAFQRKSQAAAQEKINEAAAHFNQLAQGLGQQAGGKIDRLEHMFEDRVARALTRLGLPSAHDVAELTARVAALEAALKTRPSSKPASKSA